MIKAELVDFMGTDLSVVNAARVTMGVKHGEMAERDEGLIRFLAREKHVTPFRHPTATFRCEAPIAIARQLGKHQVGFSWNEMSRRYKDGEVSCFMPEQFFLRPDNLHSGSGEAVEAGSSDHEKLQTVFEAAYDGAVTAYRGLVDAGIAPEQARFLLPQGMITEWVWTGSLYGWAELYRQRSSDHAQYEVRLFAEEIDKALSELYPISWKALKDANCKEVQAVSEQPSDGEVQTVEEQ